MAQIMYYIFFIHHQLVRQIIPLRDWSNTNRTLFVVHIYSYRSNPKMIMCNNFQKSKKNRPSRGNVDGKRKYKPRLGSIRVLGFGRFDKRYGCVCIITHHDDDTFDPNYKFWGGWEVPFISVWLASWMFIYIIKKIL